MNREDIRCLVRRAQQGEVDAFSALVREFQDITVAYATSVLGDYSLAQDAAQEAFLEAYRSLPSLREAAAFPAWLRRIVFKYCDRITRRDPSRVVGLHAVRELPDPTPSAAERLERSEAHRSLHAALGVLTPAERHVILLYYMGEHSQAAIAEFLDVTVNTVKTRLYSARNRLRASMSEIGKDLDAARPSSDPRFAEKVRRRIQPEALKQQRPWMWSPGIGTDVWEMFCACIAGDLETVRAFVARDPSLVRCHYEYRTPLSFAVRENHLDVAEFLLDNGASQVSLGDPVEMARDRGYTEMVRLLERKFSQLHGASEEGEAVAAAIRARDLAAVRRLLDERPDRIHAADTRSNQPVHWAVMTRNTEMIDELLARDADINARRGDGALVIHLTNGDYDYRGWRDVPSDVRTTPDDIYRHLVSRGAEIDLGMAAYRGEIERVRETLRRDPAPANRVSQYNSYYIGCGAPLRNAAAGGNIEIVKLLLGHGADPNLAEEGIAPRGHALYAAVSGNHYQIAKLLLEHGAYPNPPVESSADAVWIAIRAGNRRMLELLGSYGAVMEIPIRLDGEISYSDIVAAGIVCPLPILAYYGDLDAAQALLEKEPELANDSEALKMAAGQGNLDFLYLLLRLQPHLAREVTVSRPREIAELLFARGMDPNRLDWMRKTPLHHFAGSGDIESAALFLDNGADLHARDEEHCSTPLAVAAMKGQTRMVEYLLRRGARHELPDDPDWATPMEWARRRGHDDVIRVLQLHRTAGPPASLPAQYFEKLANDMITAFRSGDETALTNVRKHFGLERPLTWDRPSLEVQMLRLRRAIEEHLHSMKLTLEASDSLPLRHAQLLVARSEGFNDWAALVNAHGDRTASGDTPGSRQPG